jgi:putative membrane-bound dehydrogenase-like protein
MRFMREAFQIGLIVVALGSACGAEPPPAARLRSPLMPEQALREFHVDPGLRVELVACEPDIQSPVEMAFDEDGRLWVVEMRDYPNGPGPGKPPESRIVILDQDPKAGRYKLSRVFAERLPFANGLMLWRGGAIVTCAPHILYIHSNGRRDVWFDGFAAENPQLRVNHPILGIDNWIYVANGLRGGKIKRLGIANAPTVNINSMDFRFDPIGPGYEAVTGMGEYGNTFDDWGHRFVCTNRNHLIPIVLPAEYVRRNPYLAAPEPMRDNQDPGGAARVYPLSRNFTTASYHAGTFTAACGVTIYRGGWLPHDYDGSAFTCEPTGNLVHREIVEPEGAGFRSRPAREGVEFLASPDDWFRPVNLAEGPDGALYVVDMYRAVIEHPEWMPPELKNRPDLLNGKDRGRIWRIVPDGVRGQLHRQRPHLSTATVNQLVAQLDRPSGWWRTTAQRLLLECHDPASIAPLQSLCRGSQEPVARVHAAWLLNTFHELTPELVSDLLSPGREYLLEHAVRLSEPWITANRTLQEKVIHLSGDAPRIRLQVALTLGQWDDDRILAPLAAIARAGADDHWTRMAVESSVPKRAGALFTLLYRPYSVTRIPPTSGQAALLREMATLVGSRRDPQEVANVLETLTTRSGVENDRLPMVGLSGLAEGMTRRGTQLGAFLKTLPPPQRDMLDKVNRLLEQAGTLARHRDRALPERVAAIGLLTHAPWTTAGPALTQILTEAPEQELRLAAVRSLSALPNPDVSRVLMQSWRSYTPALRREVSEAMLRQPDRVAFLLDGLRAGRVRPADLDPQRTRQLLAYGRADLRTRARELLHDSLPGDRKKTIDQYRSALAMKGDVARGRGVFPKNCATCHRVAGIGISVGPDISDTLGRAPEALLVDILDPNAAIDSNYVNYSVMTKSGKVLTGLIAAESPSSITLRRAENQTEIVLRQDIEEIQSSGSSLMPEGLEKQVSMQDMADLVCFLKNWRYVGVVPGR